MSSELQKLLRDSANPALTKLVKVMMQNSGALDSVKKLSTTEKQDLIDLVAQLNQQVQDFSNGNEQKK